MKPDKEIKFEVPIHRNSSAIHGKGTLKEAHLGSLWEIPLGFKSELKFLPTFLGLLESDET